MATVGTSSHSNVNTEVTDAGLFIRLVVQLTFTHKMSADC